MSDVFSCPDPECERDLIDCGDVFWCPGCDAHVTYRAVAMQAEVLAVAAELMETGFFSRYSAEAS